MSRRSITVLGLAVAGGAGYYLYSAGGDPKVAQKMAEADASKASAKVKEEVNVMPGRGKEAEKRGEQYAHQAGAKMDSATADAKAKLAEAEAKAKEYKDKTGKELMKGVDKFDATVEKKASEAKSGLSSWFGGK